jgi:hypothetical protein
MSFIQTHAVITGPSNRRFQRVASCIQPAF